MWVAVSGWLARWPVVASLAGLVLGCWGGCGGARRVGRGAGLVVVAAGVGRVPGSALGCCRLPVGVPSPGCALLWCARGLAALAVLLCGLLLLFGAAAGALPLGAFAGGCLPGRLLAGVVLLKGIFAFCLVRVRAPLFFLGLLFGRLVSVCCPASCFPPQAECSFPKLDSCLGLDL